jgi:hypothetical protein
MHITQPRGACGDSAATLPRRTLCLSFSKRRRDAVAEPRILLRFCSGTTSDQLCDSFFHERRVAAALAQQCRTHALDVWQAYAISRGGHDGFSQRSAFSSRSPHRRPLIARTAFAHAFRYRLLAATAHAGEEACVDAIITFAQC